MKTLLLLVLSMVARRAGKLPHRTSVSANAPPWSKPSGPTPGPTPVPWDSKGLSERVPWGHGGKRKRHLFIPERSCSIAYADMPIPIGLGQTISQAVHRGP